MDPIVFEPKQQNRFLVHWDKTRSYLVRAMNVNTNRGLNTLILDLYVPIEDNLAALINPEWKGEKQQIRFSTLDHTGTTIDDVMFCDCEYVGASFDVSWDKDDLLDVRYMFRFDHTEDVREDFLREKSIIASVA